MPARASRFISSAAVKFSVVRNTALWLRTRSGPPPIAAVAPAHEEGRISRVVTDVPTPASDASFGASAPSATSTAPSAGICVAPSAVATTVACRSVFGAAAGNGWRTTTVAFATLGVTAPHAGVKRTVRFAFGRSLSPTIGCLWPVPFQVPTNENRVTRSVPFPSNATDDRPAAGPCWYTPPATTMPFGSPFALVASPLIPAVIAVVPRLRWICVTRSRGPVSVPPATTGPIVVSPPGRGAVITVSATGPRGVNCTSFS